MSARDKHQIGRELRAYHEAGHAVVGHAIGRCIVEVSITQRYDGYGGYCRFNPLVEDANDHPEWRDDLSNPDLITIFYAGMLATASYCAPYVTFDEHESFVEYPEGSERYDLEQVQKVLDQTGADQQQHKAITNTCWLQAQTILTEYWPAVDSLAQVLLKRGTLGGRAAHSLIWQTMGFPESDWRLQALDIKHNTMC